MKAIVVEGRFGHVVIEMLFPQIAERGIVLHTAQGFSNVFAVSWAFLDHGYEVLAVLDTDSHRPGNDNRVIIERLVANNLPGRNINIVWMDPFIEKVIDRAVPGFWHGNKPKVHALIQFLNTNKDALLQLNEFQQIRAFVEA